MAKPITIFRGSRKLFMTNSCKNSFSWWPTAFMYAIRERCPFQSNKTSPVRQAKSPFIKSQVVIMPTIVTLFLSCSPFAIVLGISIIIINSFNCMFRRRTMSHVGKKCCKIVFPFLANSDTSAAVIFKGLIFWICTTLNYLRPYHIFSGVRQAMYKMTFILNTATALCVSRAKLPCCNNRCISANAFTLPACFTSATIFGAGNHCKFIEWLIRKINEVVVRHIKNLQAKVASKLESGRRLLEYRFSGMTLAAKT